MHETILKKHGIAHWSVIKHARQHEDLVILTKPRKQCNKQTFMEVGIAYWEDPYLAPRELVAS